MYLKETVVRLFVFSIIVVLIFFSSVQAKSDIRVRAESYEPQFAAAAAQYRVDPRLLWTVAFLESRFRQDAVSPKGARGLMQLIPATAARFGVRDSFDARQNIDGGARYLRFLLDLFDGDVPLTLAAYNAGEGAVMKYGRRVPPYRETQAYVAVGQLVLARVADAGVFPNDLITRCHLAQSPSAFVNRSPTQETKSVYFESGEASIT